MSVTKRKFYYPIQVLYGDGVAIAGFGDRDAASLALVLCRKEKPDVTFSLRPLAYYPLPLPRLAT